MSLITRNQGLQRVIQASPLVVIPHGHHGLMQATSQGPLAFRLSANRIAPFSRDLSGSGILHARLFPFGHPRAQAPRSARDCARLLLPVEWKDSSFKLLKHILNPINRFYITSQQPLLCHSFNFCHLELEILLMLAFLDRT